MNLTCQISSYKELIDDHQVFVFDLCGVVHDGKELHAPTIDFIKDLRKKNKQIIFLSNSPNSHHKALQHLKEKDFNLLDGEIIHTSGDYFLHFIKQNNYHNKKFYFFGKERNREFLLVNDFILVEDPVAADYIVASPFSSNKLEIEEITSHALSLIKYKLTYFCINPDMYAPYGDEIRYTPGYFAHMYSEAGGKVKYFGKPGKDIYEYVLKPVISNQNIKKNKIIMIGDSMRTDIQGAKNYEIKSVLVGGGYHSNISFNDKKSVGGLFEQYSFAPDYYIEKPYF